MSTRSTRIGLAVAAIAALGAAIDPLGVAISAAAVLLVAAAVVLLAPLAAAERRKAGGGGWWQALVLGTVVLAAGELAAIASEAVGGLISVAGAVLVLAGAVGGFPAGAAESGPAKGEARGGP